MRTATNNKAGHTEFWVREKNNEMGRGENVVMSRERECKSPGKTGTTRYVGDRRKKRMSTLWNAGTDANGLRRRDGGLGIREQIVRRLRRRLSAAQGGSP